MASLPSDVHELVGLLRDEGCEFVVVGAHALAVHGAPRYTGDFDLLVRPTMENARLAWRALVTFGAPLDAHGLTLHDLATPGTVYQLGLPPRRIDVLTRVSGLTFEEAWGSRVCAVVDGLELPVLGLAALVKNKRATGRTKDLLDVELLREAGAPVDG